MNSRAKHAVFIAMFLGFGSDTAAIAQPALPEKALKIVDQQVPIFCQGTSTTSTVEGYELTGSAEAGLTSTFSKLASAGFKGAGKYRSQKSNGVVAKDLAQSLANANNCRLAVLNFFAPYLLPQRQPAPRPRPVQKPQGLYLTTEPEGQEQVATLKAKVQSLQQQLDEANARPEKQSSTLRASAPTSKSPVLNVDDGDRFRLVKSLHDHAPQHGPSRVICHVMVHDKPNSKWSQIAWSELAEIIGTAGWSLEGGRVQQSFFAPGFTISVRAEDGDGFNCGYQLSQMLEQLGAKHRFIDKQVTPDLVSCERENPTHGCVAISVGDER